MRLHSFLLATPLLISCSGLAKAVTIRVQDPSYSSITSDPYSFNFTTCPVRDPYLDHGVAISADGCFGGINQVNDTITSLTLTFADTPVVQRSGPNVASSDIFGSSSFTEESGNLTFTFSGGGLPEGQSFVITEDGVTDPSQFPTVSLSFTATTPEVSPLVLVLTGMAGVEALRRRRLLA